jgi:integrase
MAEKLAILDFRLATMLDIPAYEFGKYCYLLLGATSLVPFNRSHNLLVRGSNPCGSGCSSRWEWRTTRVISYDDIVPNRAAGYRLVDRRLKNREVVELKTGSSQRCVVLPASALQALTKHRISQHEERLKLGSDYENNDLVFCTTIGTPLQPRNVIGRHLKPVLRQAGVPDIRWYDLRHTAASMLLRAGINPKIVAEKLGHASVNLTLNVYSHTIPSMQHEAAEAIEKALAG